MNPIASLIILLCGVSLFLFLFVRRLAPLLKARKDNRLDALGVRAWQLVKLGLLQKRLFRFPYSGIIHVTIFWGFLILLANSFLIVCRGFDAGFTPFFVNQELAVGRIYLLLKDITTLFVIVVTLLALFNRLVLKPKRYDGSLHAIVIILMIQLIMVSDLFYWGFYGAQNGHTGEPIAAAFSNIIGDVEVVGTVSFWIHFAGLFLFLNMLPLGKHFHVLTALPNTFFKSLKPNGQLHNDVAIEKALLDEDEDEDEVTFGVANIMDFTWKDMLDMHTCTECGRCQERCPASETGKNLSPKKLMLSLRDCLNSSVTEESTKQKKIVPGVIDMETVWECTTCGACEQECPVGNTFVNKIVDLRRNLVEEEGAVPAALAKVLRGFENNNNPWNLALSDRKKWAEDVSIKQFTSDCEYLLYVGCASAYDDKAQKTMSDLVSLLNMAGVSFGFLGNDEPCCGESARRIGSESNFRMMADSTIDLFNEKGVKKIITTCPHCLNTFKNEYPVFGGEYQVVHHTKLLDELLNEGKLKVNSKKSEKVVFHDPCYLGRYNGEFDDSRAAIKKGFESIVEPKLSKDSSMCCGAGGGHFFTEDNSEKRISSKRLEQLKDTNPDIICTACPYCATMLDDAQKLDNKKIKQLDIAQLLLEFCEK